MIVFFIPGAWSPTSPLLKRLGDALEAVAAAPPEEVPKETSGDRVLPHTAPYTLYQANLIYAAAVNVAQAMTEARGITDDTDDDPLWLVESIHVRTLRYGRAKTIPHEVILAAMSVIADSCAKEPLGPKDVAQRKGWRLSDAEGFDRMLSITIQGMAEAEHPLASDFWEDYQVRAGLKEPSEAHPLLVSTTDTCVRLHHDGVGETYDIELDRIPDFKALAQWIYHLEEKTWVTSKMIRMMMGAVCSVKGWDLHAKSL
jgi:hypothetical protein